ncbi:hypothetical protein [Paracoccus sp. S1E-3]|nr:hypothetical protein [Paracoccus sp. S1E-3]MBA4491144.1 hypothetical protein [Paracoccus sp. S1E-3]
MNRWRELLSATPMRLTLRLAALFTAVSLGSFLVHPQRFRGDRAAVRSPR